MIRIFSQYVSLKRVLLVVLEGFLIASALVCGAWIRFYNDPFEFHSYLQMPDFGLQAIFVIFTFQISFYYANYGRIDLFQSRFEELLCLAQGVGGACFFLGVVYYVFPGLLIGRGVFFISTTLVVGLVMVNRIVMDRAWIAAGHREKAMIVGNGELAHTVARELKLRADLSVEFAGYFEPAGEAFSADQMGSLEQMVQKQGISRIIVAMEDRRGLLPVRDLVTLRVQGVMV